MHRFQSNLWDRQWTEGDYWGGNKNRCGFFLLSPNTSQYLCMHRLRFNRDLNMISVALPRTVQPCISSQSEKWFSKSTLKEEEEGRGICSAIKGFYVKILYICRLHRTQIPSPSVLPAIPHYACTPSIFTGGIRESGMLLFERAIWGSVPFFYIKGPSQKHLRRRIHSKICL